GVGLWSCHPDRGIETIPLPDVQDFDLITAEEQSLWGIADSYRLLQLDYAGGIVREYLHENPIKSNLSQDQRHPPFCYSEYKTSERIPVVTFLVHADGSRQTLTEQYADDGPVVLDKAYLNKPSQRLIFDSYRLLSADERLIFDLHEQWPEFDFTLFRSLWFDRRGHLWLGNNFGLYQITIRRNYFHRFLAVDPTDIKHFAGTRSIVSIGEQVLVVQEFEGPQLIDPTTGTHRPFQTQLERSNLFIAAEHLEDGRLVISDHSKLVFLSAGGEVERQLFTPHPTWSILQPTDDQLWLGTTHGLYEVDLLTEEIRPYQRLNGYDELAEAVIYDFSRGRDGQVWISSNMGLFRIDLAEGVTAAFSSRRPAPYHLPHDLLYHSYQDQAGTLWLASGGGGLIQLVLPGYENAGWTQFTQDDGLSNNVIYAVYEEDGYLWLSSDYGIMRFEQTTGQVKTYLQQEGIAYNEFNRVSHARDSSGRLYFGGLNGVTAFRPEDLTSALLEEDPP
ncbi:MAG: hypothetical protein KDC54_22915, partial [Lewinella sp.]|nr:hypothetical protein [Lewinella sp.]